MAPSKHDRKSAESGEDQNGSIFSISGPVIVAENMIGVAMYELVRRLPQSHLSNAVAFADVKRSPVQSRSRQLGWRSHQDRGR